MNDSIKSKPYEKPKPIGIRLETEAQLKKYRELGGGPWLIEVLDKLIQADSELQKK